MFKKVLPLSGILSLGFLGLFLVLPMLSVYALSLEGATPFLVGVVVGGYALTQVVFQIPFVVPKTECRFVYPYRIRLKRDNYWFVAFLQLELRPVRVALR